MVKRTKVNTYIERLYCDECDCEMWQTGNVYLASPVTYQYRCPKCSKIVESENKYPKTVYEEID